MDIQDGWARVTAAASTAASIDTPGQRDALLRTALLLGTSITQDCVGTSITLDTTTGYATPAASNALAMDLDSAQYAAGEGPCVAACRDGRSYSIVIMGADDRYRGFTAAAHRHGVASSLSLPVPSGDRSALNLYASTTHAFSDDRARARAELLARCVARFLPHPATPAHMPAADVVQTLDKRDLIRRAREHLMEREGVSEVAAFTQMATASRDRRCSIFEVAADLLNGARDRNSHAQEDAH